MDPAAQALDALLWWRNILLICAIVLLAEAGVLTFLTALWRRPWYERVLALAPLAVFAWAVYMARQAHVAYVAAQEYATFIRAHYPEEFVWRGGELTAAAARVSHSAGPVVAATVGALVLGALLLPTRWREMRSRQIGPPADGNDSGNADRPELEITVQGLGDSDGPMR
jgi:hypothetical protein